MLCELRVSQLGVIEDLTLVFGPGLTALTGETGAGKTLVVEAIELLLGGRAEGIRVRPGAAEAVVEGRFVLPWGLELASGEGDESPGRRHADEGAVEAEAGGPVRAEGTSDETEVVLGRVVPAEGRSRGYVDGRMATLTALAQLGQRLVDLHGQHEHQSLFSAAAQRDALDAYAGADRRPRDAARRRLRQLDEAMAGGGGDAASRGREVERLRYQLSEVDAAGLVSAGEDDALATEEERLSRAASHRAAALHTYEDLSGDEQVRDRLGEIVARLAGHPPLAELHQRLQAVSAELADIASEAHYAAEQLEEDPERLAEVVARRALLHELRRKYAGPGGGVDDVMVFQRQARKRLEELENLDLLASRLDDERAESLAELRRAAKTLGRARRATANSFGEAVEAQLRLLAMPRARFVVDVSGDERSGDARELAGEDVTFLLAANPGEPLLPLSKVASGGELARAMLALRLVMLGVDAGEDEVDGTAGKAGQKSGTSERRRAKPAPGNSERGSGPATLVFDEVDAGIGGEASLAVGRALANLGRRYQVLVVTHLAQVAAFADAQVAVSKAGRDGRSVTMAQPVAGQDRVVELSRMLSGQPDSRTARLHAAELLEAARAHD
ncbi:MAG TPA: DNA repair protein RecN [Acidimicrobiales bacterium]|nr:DNA repair protein RecN [Acidimicrobiales bacterium]